MKKTIIYGSMFLLLIFICSMIYINQTKEKEAEKEPPRIVVETKKPTNNTILVVGEHTFKSSATHPFTEATLTAIEKEIPSKVRFILVPYETTISTEKINEWIEKKKVVLFYGDDVPAKEMSEKFGVDISQMELQSNVGIPFVLFGYGYNYTQQRNIIYFLKDNDSTQKELFDFIDSIL